MHTTFDFIPALVAYEDSLTKVRETRIKYKIAHARATLQADGKNAEARAAQADLQSIDELNKYEAAKADESVRRAAIDFAIAQAHGGPAIETTITVGGVAPAEAGAAVAAELAKTTEGAS